MPAHILVATDGRPGAMGALRWARLLEQRDGSGVEVLAVLETSDIYTVASPEAVAIHPSHFIPTAQEALRNRVRDQLARVDPEAASWPIELAMGPIARTIARMAAKHDAGLVMLGLRRSRAVESWLARETLLRVIHLSTVPVLAVPEDSEGLPRRAVVATDFSECCGRALGTLIDLLGPDAELHLAHVTSEPPGSAARREGRTDSEDAYRAAHLQLDRFARDIRPDIRAPIVHTLHGAAGPAILKLAEEIDAELIAAGSRGAGALTRLVMGSVSSELVHRGTGALLIAPPVSPPADELLDLSEGELLANLGTAGAVALSDAPAPAEPRGGRSRHE